MVKNMDTKSNNILWNIKTMQISMINHVKHVLFKYHPLLVKMALDAPTIASPTSNLCFLVYVGIECHYGTRGGNSFFDQICSRLLDVFGIS
jgi:hypothetical protein